MLFEISSKSYDDSCEVQFFVIIFHLRYYL